MSGGLYQSLVWPCWWFLSLEPKLLWIAVTIDPIAGRLPNNKVRSQVCAFQRSGVSDEWRGPWHLCNHRRKRLSHYCNHTPYVRQIPQEKTVPKLPCLTEVEDSFLYTFLCRLVLFRCRTHRIVLAGKATESLLSLFLWSSGIRL